MTPGLVISAAQAEALLPVNSLNRWQREALVSFCFNVGAREPAERVLAKSCLGG